MEWHLEEHELSAYADTVIVSTVNFYLRYDGYR